MHLLPFARKATTLVAASVFSLGVAAVSANAATPAQPDFTCGNPDVCIFQGPNLSGLVLEFPTSDHSQWINLTNPFGAGPSGLTLPWGGFNDNSGSSVAFGDAQTGAITCFPAGTRDPNPPSSVRHDRFMWIEFGVSDCSVHLPPPG